MSTSVFLMLREKWEDQKVQMRQIVLLREVVIRDENGIFYGANLFLLLSWTVM